MNAKRYLEGYRQIKQEITWINNQIEKIKSELDYHPIQLDNSGASHLNYREDKMASKMAEVVDLYKELEQRRLDLTLREGKIYKMVRQIDDVKERKVLVLRYLTEHPRKKFAPLSWREIGFRMGYTAEGVRHIHDRALKNFSAIMKKTES